MKKFGAILLGAVLALLSVTSPSNATSPVTMTQAASFLTTAEVQHNTVTVLPNGTKAITWRESKVGQPTVYKASYILPDGTVGTPWDLMSDTNIINPGWDPAILVEPTGRVTMLFVVTKNTPITQTPYVSDLYVTQTMNGITWTPPRIVAQTPSFASCVSENLCGYIRPQIAKTAAGGIVSAFAEVINHDYIRVLSGYSDDGLNWGGGVEVGRAGIWSDLQGQSMMQLKTSGMTALIAYSSGEHLGPSNLMSSYATDANARIWSTPATVSAGHVELSDIALAPWGANNFYAMWKEGSSFKKISGASFNGATKTWGTRVEIETCQVIPSPCSFLELDPENVFSSGNTVTAAWLFSSTVGNNMPNDSIHAVTVNSGVPGKPVLVTDGEWGQGINQDLALIASGHSPNSGWFFWLRSRTIAEKTWLGQGANPEGSSLTRLSELSTQGNTSLAQDANGDLWVSIAVRTDTGRNLLVYKVKRSAAPGLSGRFILSAKPKVGQVLTAPSGNWYSVAPTVTKYQWLSCSKPITKVVAATPSSCSPIKGETKAKFTPGASLANKLVTVLVSQTNGSGTTKAIAPTVSVAR